MNPFLKKSKQLSIFLTAGFPFIDSLTGQLEELESYQIDFIEVGIPFSDPLADGPIIQNTSQVALKNGMNLDLIFKQLAKRSTKIPLVLMGYINPIISFGLEKFLKICKRVNISAVIIPDMSLEIYDRFYSVYFEKNNVSPCFLITLKTPKDRIRKMCERSKKQLRLPRFF
jgi:tryptophan synthase alpha chain